MKTKPKFRIYWTDTNPKAAILVAINLVAKSYLDNRLTFSFRDLATNKEVEGLGLF